jgi:hypothetical protein
MVLKNSNKPNSENDLIEKMLNKDIENIPPYKRDLLKKKTITKEPIEEEDKDFKRDSVLVKETKVEDPRLVSDYAAGIFKYLRENEVTL